MEYNFSIRGDIGGWWGVAPSDVTSYLSKHKDEDVDIAICSPGGYVDAGLEIYQAFKDHGKVHAHIIGMTASAATIIAMGAKTIDIVSSSLMLIHNASMVIDYWTSVNKEKIDDILKEIQKTRDDLKTIDDVITDIYVERSGQSADIIKQKMNEGKWLTANDALELGLVDSIRIDKDAEKTSNEMRNQFTNSMCNHYGLPALPDSAVADANGNPTEGFMHKIINAVKEFIKSNNSTTTKMKKVFKNVCALIATDALEGTEDVVNVNVSDMQKIEDRLAELEKSLTDANTAKENVQKQLDTANSSIADLKGQIKNLKAAPGEDPDELKEEDEVVDRAANIKLFNAINN